MWEVFRRVQDIFCTPDSYDVVQGIVDSEWLVENLDTVYREIVGRQDLTHKSINDINKKVTELLNAESSGRKLAGHEDEAADEDEMFLQDDNHTAGQEGLTAEEVKSVVQDQIDAVKDQVRGVEAKMDRMEELLQLVLAKVTKVEAEEK